MAIKTISIGPSVDCEQTVPFRRAPDFRLSSTFLAIELVAATSAVLNLYPPGFKFVRAGLGDLFSAYLLPVNCSPLDFLLEVGRYQHELDNFQ